MTVSRIVLEENTLTNYDLWASLDASGFAVYRLRELELAQFDLTIEQAAILRLLKTLRRGTTVKEIKDFTLRQQNSISILINRMVGAGLVTKERKAGERDLTMLVTEEGRGLLRKISSTCLAEVFSVLSQDQKVELSNSLGSLYQKARSLLVPEKPPFMQYITRDSPTIPSIDIDSGSGVPSDYLLWSRLDSARFAVSRLRELELAPFGLSVEQATIMRVLHDHADSLTFRDLEDATLRQHHSVSTLVNRMTKMGLTRIEAKPRRERYRISITSKGKNLLAGIRTMSVDMAFSSLAISEKRELRIFLLSIYRKARALLGASDLG